MRRPGPIIALAVIVAVNLAMLLGVWQARRGAPEAVLRLDERELRLSTAGPDATTVTLRLAHNQTHWTDRRLIESLGFDISAHSLDPRSYALYRGVLPRRVYVVCELGGAAWARRLTQWQANNAPGPAGDNPADASAGPASAPSVEDLAERASRLMEIDLGTDADALRARYPDRGRYLILPAIVGLRVSAPRDGEPVEPFSVRVLQLLPAQVVVPTRLRQAFEGVTASVARPRVTTVRPGATPQVPAIVMPPRYEVTLGVDRAHQLYLVDAQRLAR